MYYREVGGCIWVRPPRTWVINCSLLCRSQFNTSINLQMKDDVLPPASEMRYVSLPVHCLSRGSLLMYEHSRFLAEILEFLIFYLLHAFCEHTFFQCNLWSPKFSSAFSTMHSKVSFTSSKGKNRSPNNLHTLLGVKFPFSYICVLDSKEIYFWHSDDENWKQASFCLCMW